MPVDSPTKFGETTGPLSLVSWAITASRPTSDASPSAISPLW